MPGRATNEPSNYFALGKQTAKGTAASTFTYLRHLDGTGFEITEDVESVREGGDGQEVGLRYKTSIGADGAAVTNSRPEIAARLLAWTLGADTTSVPAETPAGSGAVNIHTIAPTSTLPYLTAEQYWADQVERALDCKITELVIEGEQGRPLKITANLLAGGTVSFPASQTTASRETGQPHFFPGGSYIVEGAANTKLTKFRTTIRRSVDDAIRTTGLNREDVIEQNFDVMHEMTLKYEDATSIYDKVHSSGGQGSQIPFDLATGAFEAHTQFGTGSNLRKLDLYLGQFHYTGARVNKLDPDGKTMYIDVTCEGYKGATHQVHAAVWTASVAALV